MQFEVAGLSPAEPLTKEKIQQVRKSIKRCIPSPKVPKRAYVLITFYLKTKEQSCLGEYKVDSLIDILISENIITRDNLSDMVLVLAEAVRPASPGLHVIVTEV